MFAVTATDQYSLLRKAVHMCYGQMEIPRSHLVVHVLIADVDVPVLTLEKSTGAADLSKYGNSQKKSKSQLPQFQWEFTAVSFVVAIKKKRVNISRHRNGSSPNFNLYWVRSHPDSAFKVWAPDFQKFSTCMAWHTLQEKKASINYTYLIVLAYLHCIALHLIAVD